MAVTISYLESFLSGVQVDLRRRIASVLRALLRHIEEVVEVERERIDNIVAGQIAVKVSDGGTVTISDTTNYFEANSGPTWTYSPVVAKFDMSAGNGRLTYIGDDPIMVHAAMTLSFSSPSNNQVCHARMGVSGTTDPMSEVVRKLSVANDVGSTAIHLVTTLVKGDYLSLFLRNETSTADFAVEAANIQCMTMPME